MKKYVCEPCGYVYDPEVGDPDNGIAPGTAFEDIPEDWVCPICGMDKSVFVEEQAILCSLERETGRDGVEKYQIIFQPHLFLQNPVKQETESHQEVSHIFYGSAAAPPLAAPEDPELQSP